MTTGVSAYFSLSSKTNLWILFMGHSMTPRLVISSVMVSIPPVSVWLIMCLFLHNHMNIEKKGTVTPCILLFLWPIRILKLEKIEPIFFVLTSVHGIYWVTAEHEHKSLPYIDCSLHFLFFSQGRIMAFVLASLKDAQYTLNLRQLTNIAVHYL